MADTPIIRKWLVYKITSRITGMAYIGQTTHTISNRWSHHKSRATYLKSQNRPLPPLYKAMLDQGHEAFGVEVIAEASEVDTALAQERRFIEVYNSMFPCGYNARPGGGERHSDDTRLKMRAVKVGRNLPPEHRAKMSKAQRGKGGPAKAIGSLKSPLVGGNPISGHRGVRPANNGWMVRMKVSGKTVYLGTFPTKEEASDIYQKAVAARIAELEAHQNAEPPASGRLSKPYP